VADRAPLHPVSRQHLEALTGELGIFQHAIGSQPDPAHGYCVDDVARALEVDLLHARTLGWARVSDSARRNMTFLEEAFDPSTVRFRNFRHVDGEWIGGPGSNDSFGRAMLALGQTIATAPDAPLVDRAMALFELALPAAGRLASPRAQASVVLACAAASEAMPGTAATETLRRLATGLHVRFIDFARPGWPWAESTLTYENALLPRALIVAGAFLDADVMLRIGLQVLDWLIEVQTAPDGHLSPIGNGWWPRGGTKSQFDQQPIEATALLLAADAAHQVTHQPRYLAVMERAYAWFLGENDLGRRVAIPIRGASSDGVTAKGLNTNQGAESTLMWLMAAECIRAARVEPAPGRTPAGAGRAPVAGSAVAQPVAALPR
jgi:hypothetical protein